MNDNDDKDAGETAMTTVRCKHTTTAIEHAPTKHAIAQGTFQVPMHTLGTYPCKQCDGGPPHTNARRCMQVIDRKSQPKCYQQTRFNPLRAFCKNPCKQNCDGGPLTPVLGGGTRACIIRLVFLGSTLIRVYSP